MHSIGELARASGLTVSALRFYDRAGVLVPALVDPQTGYRWYAEGQVRPARLVASLRRVGMPLPEIARAVRLLPDSGAVRSLLEAQLRRLEAGLTDARRELARAHALLDPEETTMTTVATRLRLPAAALAAAVDAVRFAVGDDADLPVLRGVLLEAAARELRLVATDRYRLAVAGVPITATSGPTVRALLPAEFVDRLRARLDGAGDDVRLTVEAGRVTVAVAGRELTTEALPDDFPDYRRALGDRPTRAAHRVTVDVAALRDGLAAGVAPTVVREHAGVPYDVAVLAVDRDGALAVVGADAWDADGSRHVAVNREFLLDALAAAGQGQLVLELDGPIRPLAVRAPGDERSFSILMPVRL